MNKIAIDFNILNRKENFQLDGKYDEARFEIAAEARKVAPIV